MTKLIHRKITSKSLPKKQASSSLTAAEKGREKRIDELLRFTPTNLVAYSRTLGFRNIQFKKFDKFNPQNNVNREKIDIATMVFEKEIELGK